MEAKLLFQKSLAFLLLILALSLSLLVSPKIDGGVNLEWHSGVLLNFIIAVLYSIVLGREASFRGWSTLGAVLTLVGVFAGVFAITNVVLISPYEGYGLINLFLIEIGILIFFRNLFMPFHMRGRQLIVNVLVAALFGLIFKLFVFSGDIPILSKYVSVNPAFKGYLNLPYTSALWLSSLGLTFLGLYLMGNSVKGYNEMHLEEFKHQINIEPKHLLVLGIKNSELLGLSRPEIEDLIGERMTQIMEEGRKFEEFKQIVAQLSDIENSWAAPAIPDIKQKLSIE